MVNKEYIICERDMSVILEKNGWYILWSPDNWLQEGRTYSNPDWAGINTVDAFNRFKSTNKESDKIIKEYLNKLYGK